jgi:hypothetical protein
VTQGETQSTVDHLFKLTYRLTLEDWAAFEHLPQELVGREKLYAVLPIILAGGLVGFLHEEIGSLIPWLGTGMLGPAIAALVIGRVIETPTHVFLCPSPREAIIVPRRAFDTEADMYVFAQRAEELGEREPTSREP